MKKIFLLLVIVFSVGVVAQEEGGKGKVIFKYKKFESFDFDDMLVEGGAQGRGDLSIQPRFQEKFKNKLPFRKNFNPEIRKAVSRIK